MHDAPPRTAVVADRRPLERSLLRFLLEDEGFAVRAEAGSMSDLLLALQREMPDAVVLHEHLAHGHDDAVVEQVRWLAPGSTIVVVTRDLERTPAALHAIADVTIADGVGVAGLGLALTRPSGTLAPVTSAAGSTDPPVRVVTVKRASRRWVERLQGAVAASIVALAVIVLRDGGAVLRPIGDGAVLTAPAGDVGPLAPDRPTGDRDGTESGASATVVQLALALPSAVASQDLTGGAGPDTEPVETPTGAPAPTETPAPAPTDPPPTPATKPTATARPGAHGPPAAVVAKLKPKVQEVVSQLPPRGGGPPDRPRPGGGVPGGTPPGAGSSEHPRGNGTGNRPPWAGRGVGTPRGTGTARGAATSGADRRRGQFSPSADRTLLTARRTGSRTCRTHPDCRPGCLFAATSSAAPTCRA